jgi:hypothetical protein
MTLGSVYSAKQIEIKCEFIFKALVDKKLLIIEKVAPKVVAEVVEPADEDKPQERTKKGKKPVYDAMDARMDDFNEYKNRMPPPEVIHDKGDHFKSDIIVNSVTVIAGNKTLLEDA